jgi:glycine/D-amino acid oxidase-like deaminating enzyme
MDRYDLIVVGAGVTGASTALYYKKSHPDHKVLLIDRFANAGMGNSSKSAGKFRNTVTSRVSFALCDSSIDAMIDIQASGTDIGLKMTGYLWLMDEEKLERNQEAIETMRRYGVDLEVFDQGELVERLSNLQFDAIPDLTDCYGVGAVRAGLFGRKCGSVEADLLTRYYADEFVSLGGETMFETEVLNPIVTDEGHVDMASCALVLYRTDRAYGVHTDKGDILAERTMFTCGAYTYDVLDDFGIDGRVKCKKRQLFILDGVDLFEDIRGFNRSDDGREIGLPFTVFPVKGLYIFRHSQNELYVGCADEIGRAYTQELDPQPERMYGEMLVSLLSYYIPGLKVNTAAIKGIAGMYNMTTFEDGVPNVDQILEGLYIANGSSGRGIMTGDAVGRIAAARLSGSEEAELHGGERFRVSTLGVDAKRRDVDPEHFSI